MISAKSRMSVLRGAILIIAPLALVTLSTAMAGSGEEPTGPIRKGDKLLYPEGYNIPRYETELEKRYADEFNISRAARGSTPPPTGPIRAVGEYEPMESIMIAYEGGSSLWTILDQMTAQITTVGNADVYCICDSSGEITTATTRMSNAGANMSRVHFLLAASDTIWMRDYGPRYIYQGDCRAVVDHTYNRPTRPNDNNIPFYFAGQRDHAYYELPLVHGGGNYHLNALGESDATELIWNENPGLTHQQIHDYWLDYQNVDTTIRLPFPTSVDSTQHIDMWMQIYDDNKVFISDWPNNVGSTQDNICDSTAADMANNGWQVTRIPARSISSYHYTYVNMVLCNNLVLLPLYTNGTVSPLNASVLATVQAAMPTKTVVQVNCQAIVGYAGVMHCIVMHVPANLGGANPTAYLLNLNGGESFDPGNIVQINWISDDDVDVVNVDILLSTDGGANFDTTIVSATADDGAYNWNVPDVYAPNSAQIRIVARDGQGNTGIDDSDASFTIDGTPPASCPANLDAGDNVVDVFDMFILLGNWGTNGNGADLADDTNIVDVFDLFVLLGAWGNCP